MKATIRPFASQALRRCVVRQDTAGLPVCVDQQAVLTVREEWRVEQGWWETPSRRRYFSLVLEERRVCTIFEDRQSHHWWRHGR